jgi:ribose/xylose/arabinose/galactoside ABC-type transport system permease subunit
MGSKTVPGPDIAAGTASTGAAARISAAYRRLQLFREIGMVLAIVLIGVVFTLINPTFAHVENLTNITSQIAIVGVLAVSTTFVLVTGEIDLSVGSMVAVAAVVFGLLLEHDVPLVVAIVLTLLAGCAMGAVNAALSIAFAVPTIIITLGMLSAYRGLAFLLSDGYPVEQFEKTGWFWDLGTGKVAGIPYDALVLLVFALASGYMLRSTRVGLRLYAMGSNRRAAEVAGLRVDRIKTGALVFNGFAAGLAALLAVAQASVGDPNLGTGYELDAIAAVIIGGAKLAGGAGTVLASVLGILLIGVIRNGLVIVGVSIYLLIVVSGLVVIAAVAIDRFFVRRRQASAGA